MIRKYKKTIILSLITILALPFFIVGFVSLGYRVAYGQLAPGAVGLFGGQIQGTFQCGCSGSHLIWVGPPRAAGPIHFGPWSIPHEYFQFKRPGAWVLGDLIPPTPCVYVCLLGCCTFMPEANIRLIGSSH